MKFLILLSVFFSLTTWSNPYFDETKIKIPQIDFDKNRSAAKSIERKNGLPVLRIEVSWSSDESFAVTNIFKEDSGTIALYKSASIKDSLGSYKAELSMDTPNGSITFHSSLGTGREFRRLVRTLAFRFPIPANSRNFKLKVEAENPETGIIEKVLEKQISIENAKKVEAQNIRLSSLREATKQPVLKFNIYSEGYDQGGEARFIKSALEAITAFEQKVPGHEHFEFNAVFAPSNVKIGKAVDRGNEVQIQDSFLGLYFPHWRKFGRWYNVVYPTSETKYRNGLAQAPYDYALALVDDSQYWGVGNYKELTAVPAGAGAYIFLLLHEFGHYMGLNEEYEGGGPTELEFAPKTIEPWSQNITFNPDQENIKWSKHLAPGIIVPTSNAEFQRMGGLLINPVGAYKGGYADSLPRGKSHKPVKKCMMGMDAAFCPVCQDAMTKLIRIDAGEAY